MTKREKELLEIAKKVISENSHIGASLSGSLLFAYLDIPKRNEAHDIDIICSHIEGDKFADYYPKVDNDWEFNKKYGGNSDLSSISFIKGDIKLDFIQCDDEGEKIRIIDGVRCGEVNKLIKAKHFYSIKDEREKTRKKHKEDLEYLSNFVEKVLTFKSEEESKEEEIEEFFKELGLEL